MHLIRTGLVFPLVAATLLLGIPPATAQVLQTRTVAAVADLQQAEGAANASMQVLGYSSAGDGGGGLFLWRPNAAAADLCVTFAARGAGHWQRQLNGRNLQVEDCGARSDGSDAAATRQAFQRAADHVLRSANPTATIGFRGASYQFDDNTVTIAGKYNCPNFVGGGSGTLVRFSPSRPGTPAFRFTGVSGARCGGGIRDFTLMGNTNATGVRLEGVTGATIRFTMGANIATGVVLCNCGPGQFTEMNDIKVDSDGLKPGQQTIVTQVAGGNDSFAGNSLAGYVSLAPGVRTRPVVEIGRGSYWYNGRWDMNVHNINGGGPATLLANNSSNCAKASAGTLQLEMTDAAALTVAAGCVYFGGSVYALGANACSGLKYGDGLVLAATSTIGPGGVQQVSGARQHCLRQEFAGSAGVTLSRLQVAEFATTYSVTISNADNSYNQTATFTISWNTSGPGACTISAPAWAPTIDANGWGPPSVSCGNGRPRIGNPRWSSRGAAGRFSASYDVQTQ